MRTMVCEEGRHAFGYDPVTSDVFHIASRIKEIDPRFFVMFNKLEQKFEVHVKGQPDTTYGCTIPYRELDARALEYVRKFSAARIRATVREMDEANERLERRNSEELHDKAGYKMAEALRYADHHPSRDLGDGEIPKELVNE